MRVTGPYRRRQTVVTVTRYPRAIGQIGTKWLGYSYCYMYEGLRNYRLLPPNGASTRTSYYYGIAKNEHDANRVPKQYDLVYRSNCTFKIRLNGKRLGLRHATSLREEIITRILYVKTIATTYDAQPSRKEWAEKMSCFLSGLPSYNHHSSGSSSFIPSKINTYQIFFLGIGY